MLLCSTAAGLIEKVVSHVAATHVPSNVHNIYTSVDHNFIVHGGFIAHNFSYLRAMRVWLHKHTVDRYSSAAQPALHF